MPRNLAQLVGRWMAKPKGFQFLFNISPMYRRTNGRILSVSEDMREVWIKIKLNFRNRNYVGTMFGGSLFGATDPILMLQWMQILGRQYVVWDKKTTIHFKRPANTTAYCQFLITPEEISRVQKQLAQNGAMDWETTLRITNPGGKTVFAEVEKTVYIATKAHYKQKRAQRKQQAEKRRSN